jgi:Zn-dependent protease with chaperone function
MSAGVVGRRSRTTLFISSQFLQLDDDAALKAIISHEVIHLASNDLKRVRVRAQSNFFIPYFLGFFLIVLSGKSIAWLLWVAFLVPGIRITSFLTGFLNRSRETRADVQGAAVIGDQEAMVRGLQIVSRLASENRKLLYGPSKWRWLLFPFSLPATTHPSIAKRVDRLHLLAGSTNFEP